MSSEFSAFDHECMAQALRLARQGQYSCDPNPRVGCLITQDQRVLATGWHQQAGSLHAEAMALNELQGQAQGATAFVTLEPCSHQGLTPPCSQALIEAGIQRVVYAVADPDPRVNGRGAEQLRAAGIQVQKGLMQKEAEDLNAGFFSRIRRDRPWVRIKTAISLDGRTALRSGESQWISCTESRRDVQLWRARSSALLTGIGTLLADDPRFTARVDFPARQPICVVMDSHWRTPPDCRLMNNGAEVLVYGLAATQIPAALQQGAANCIALPAQDGRPDLRLVLQDLARRGVNEVQVEAGGVLNAALLEAGVVDEILVYQAPVLLGLDSSPPFAIGPLESMQERTHLQLLESIRIGSDQRLRFGCME